jgi:hypothetical protein
MTAPSRAQSSIAQNFIQPLSPPKELICGKRGGGAREGRSRATGLSWQPARERKAAAAASTFIEGVAQKTEPIVFRAVQKDSPRPPAF